MRRDEWTIVDKCSGDRAWKRYYKKGDPHGYRSLVEVARNYYPECLEDEEGRSVVLRRLLAALAACRSCAASTSR